MKTLLVAGGITATLLCAGAAAFGDWALIRVDHRGEGRLIVPAPLSAVQFGLRWVDEETRNLGFAFDAETLAAAKQAAGALEDAGDAELIRVEDGDEIVRISLTDGLLEAQACEPGEEVAVSLGVAALGRALEDVDAGRPLFVEDLIGALRRQPGGHVVHVENRDERVDIWLW